MTSPEERLSRCAKNRSTPAFISEAEKSPRRAETILDKLAADQLTLRLEVDPHAVASLSRAANRSAWLNSLSRSFVE